jgi:hypothetical protein
VHNYFLIEHNYLQYVIYNSKPELKIWINCSVIRIIILNILFSQVIIQYFNSIYLKND